MMLGDSTCPYCLTGLVFTGGLTIGIGAIFTGGDGLDDGGLMVGEDEGLLLMIP